MGAGKGVDNRIGRKDVNTLTKCFKCRLIQVLIKFALSLEFLFSSFSFQLENMYRQPHAKYTNQIISQLNKNVKIKL